MTNSSQAQLIEILQKEKKTLEETHHIYDQLRRFHFFEHFFIEHLIHMDKTDILSICKGAKYEQFRPREFVIQKDEISHKKLYVLLSGKACLLLPHKLGASPSKTGNKLVQGTLKHHINKIMNNMRFFSPITKPGSPTNSKAKSLHRINTMFLSNTLATKSKDDTGKDKFTLKLRDAKYSVPASLVEEIARRDNDPKIALKLESFSECAAQIGEISHYLHEGEGCGELGHSTMELNTVSVICETECEFAVFSQDQFVPFLQRQEVEKADFFKAVFPFLASTFGSSSNLKLFLNCFRTEVYAKGSYLITEGKLADKEPEFYFIQKGDCLLEKEHTINVVSPYAREQPVIQDKKHLPLTKISQGTILGEEILLQTGGYNYSAKVVSDILVVQVATKKSFEEPRFKEFHQFVVKMYLKKKKQRDAIFEAGKRDIDNRGDDNREESIFAINNTAISHLMNKSSIHGFSRCVTRDHKLLNSTSLATKSLLMNRSKNGCSPDKNDEEKKMTQWASPAAVEKQKIIGSKETVKKRRFKDINSRLEYITKVPDSEKSPKNAFGQKAIDERKLFAVTDLKYLRRYKSLVGKLTGQSFEQPDFLNMSKQNCEPMSVLLKNLDKNMSLDSSYSHCYTEVKDNKGVKDSKIDESILLSPIMVSSSPTPSMKNLSYMKFNASTSKLQKDQASKSRPTTASSNLSRSGITTPKTGKTQHRIRLSQDRGFFSPVPARKDSITIQGEFNTYSEVYSPKARQVEDHDDLSPIKLYSTDIIKESIKRDSTCSIMEFASSEMSLLRRFSRGNTLEKSMVQSPTSKPNKIDIRQMSSNLRRTTSPHNAKILNARNNRNKIFQKASLKIEDFVKP